MADTPGIELGALDVALRATGADTVQAAFEAIDKAGQKTAQSTAKAASAVADFGRLTSAEVQKAADWFDKTYAAQLKTAEGQRALNSEISAELTELQQLARQVDVTKAHEVERFMQTAAASKEWLIQQEANQQQMLRFDGIMQRVNTRVEQVGERGAHSFKLMAGNAAVLAAGVGSSVRSMDSLLANAANLSFLFGPEGQIAAAIAITGSVLVREFFGWRSQIAETEKAAADELKKLIFDASSAETEGAVKRNAFALQQAQERLQQAHAAMASALELERKSNASLGAEKIKASAEKELGAAQKDVNDLTAKAITLAQLAGKQYAIETANTNRLAQAEKDRNAVTERAHTLAEQRKQDFAFGERQMIAFNALMRKGPSFGGTGPDLDQIIQQQLDKMSGLSSATSAKGLLAGFKLPDNFQQQADDILRAMGADVLAAQEKALESTKAAADQSFLSFGADLGQSFASAVGAGFKRGFKSLETVVPSGLGRIFEQMGEKLVVYGVTMLKLLPFLHNPFTSGPAALIAGAALIALGASLGAVATGSGGASAGAASVAGVGAAAPTAHTFATAPRAAVPTIGVPVTPPRPVQIINPVFLSPRTPEFQAIVADTYNYANNRGLIKRGPA